MASLGEIEVLLDKKLGSLEKKLEKKLGLENDQTFVQAVNAAFGKKLKIGENQSVDLPKMARQVDNSHERY
jgi:hypothetical protein